ncbi:MAG: Rieske (2Fe-2S) protein [Candidatus Bathyarchaeota archaeon]|nr:Rieske (2Fe-2S) protein [Candidatus Bathyarchaeota archaeon]
MSNNEGYTPIIAESELPEGTMKLIRVEGRPVLFIKHNAKLYILDDRCPHMGCKLSGGKIDGDFVVCPCHDWRFNLETGEYENNPEYILTTYPFKVKDGKIWVKLDEDF